MSVSTARDRAVEAVEGLRPARIVALAGVLTVLGAFLAVLHEILVITGDPTQLYYVVVAAAVAGTVLARLISQHTAVILGAIAVVGGTYLYIQSLPGGFGFLVLLVPMLGDAIALLSGLSVLRIVNADVWALAIAPGPVFLAWYLGLRGKYAAASAVGGSALGFMVLTGDATTTMTLAGVLGVTLALAFGDCDRREEPLRNADGIIVVLATMVVLTLFVGVVPGAAGSFISTEGVGSQESTIESSLVYAGDSVAVTGPVKLSPDVRYTVEADEESYWRVGTYDRYTGGGWVRSGELRTYQGQLPGPPGDSRELDQTYTAEATIATLPAANKPTSIDDVPVPVQVTDAGAFQPASPLQSGESYSVESRKLSATPSDLRNAGTSYPDGVESRYTQLPESSPERVEERTTRLTANAENPYDSARVIEQWLQNNYEYSLDVERPRGNIADQFLFEMDAGYCTYFATTMVTMLRTQDIPARFVVGYTPGQQVDTNEWVVRGYNSHAWVEVYFPEQGWVKFDPTPAAPRESAERQRLDSARDSQNSGVDTDDSLNSSIDQGTPEPTDEGQNGTNGGPTETNGTDSTPPSGQTGPSGSDGDGFSLPTIPVPTPEQLGFGVIIIAGLIAGARRTGASGRLYRELWLRRLPDGDPEVVVAGAYHRLIHLEERGGRTKRPGETQRQFLADADGRAKRIGDLYEQARYGDGVDEAAAAEAAGLLAELLDERSRLPHRV
ncbi:MAG: transglutaminase-like putative cysteine protease [Natronomonas sp.]|uniref:transglutaminase TgpA family protein n=1 Tax=Natronomonas sp. TaxID=2184060 RepID=UPI003988C87F